MQTYWDLTERERSALTEEQVRAFTDVELMTAGVLRVAPLELLPVVAAPPPDQKLYTLGNHHRYSLHFKSEADATLAASLLVEVSTKYLTKDGWNGPHVEVIDTDKPSPDAKTVAVYSAGAYAAALEAITRSANATAENKRRTEEHEKAVEAQREALSKLWDDWHACGRKAVRLERVLSTYNEYLKLCDGVPHTAAKFLGKAFTRAEIEDAAEWFGVVISTDAPAEAAA